MWTPALGRRGGLKLERKEVNVVLLNDFEEFLKRNNLFEKYTAGELKCHVCGKSITSDNIAMIFNSDGYKFCCDNNDCIGNIK